MIQVEATPASLTVTDQWGDTIEFIYDPPVPKYPTGGLAITTSKPQGVLFEAEDVPDALLAIQNWIEGLK